MGWLKQTKDECTNISARMWKKGKEITKIVSKRAGAARVRVFFCSK